jgi:hypothetical protein
MVQDIRARKARARSRDGMQGLTFIEAR